MKKRVEKIEALRKGVAEKKAMEKREVFWVTIAKAIGILSLIPVVSFFIFLPLLNGLISFIFAIFMVLVGVFVAIRSNVAKSFLANMVKVENQYQNALNGYQKWIKWIVTIE